MADGVAVTIEIIAAAFGDVAYVPTNDIELSLTIHGADDSVLLWRCEDGDQGEVLADASNLARQLAQGCSERFPYES